MYAEHSRQHYLSLINLIQRARNLSMQLKVTTSTVEPGRTPANLRNVLTVGETTPNHMINVLHMVLNAKAVERPITGLEYAVQSPSLGVNHAVNDMKIPECMDDQKLEIDKPGVKHLPQEL